MGVADHVVQRLLSHAVQAECGVPSDDGWRRVEVQRDRDRVLATSPFAFRAERLDQPELFQDRRVQLVGQGVDVLAEAYEPLT